MAGARKRIGLREIEALGQDEDVWDAAVSGFGVRRQRSEAVAYVLMYRTLDGRQRRYTIGRHGSPWTPDTARVEAKRLLGLVASGADPAADKQSKRDAATVGELCDLYLADAKAGRLLTKRGVSKKASTLKIDRGRVEVHIKPLMGTMRVPAVTTHDVEAFMHAVAEGATSRRVPSGNKGYLSYVRGGKGAATRTIGLLGAIFTYAVRKRLRANNPVHGVLRFAIGKRERRLSDAEYAQLAVGLAKAAELKQRKTTPREGQDDSGMWRPALAVIRFLALTGWRSGEALTLRWHDLDLPRRTARLPDTKTGLSVRPLSQAACDVLAGLTRSAPGALVFPSSRGADTRMTGFTGMFSRVTTLGGLPADVTPHVLRHSFASLAGDLGYSESTIAALVGHKGQSITSRYVHAADAVLLAAADAVAGRTAELMGEAAPAGKVVKLRPNADRAHA